MISNWLFVINNKCTTFIKFIIKWSDFCKNILLLLIRKQSPSLSIIFYLVTIYWFKSNNIFYDKTQGQCLIPLILSTHFHNFVDIIYDAKNVVVSYSTAIVYQDIDTGLASIWKTANVSINNFPANLFLRWVIKKFKCNSEM